MKFNAEKYAPLGFPIALEIKVFLSSLAIACTYSLGFLIRYFDAKDLLYETTLTGKKVLIEGAVMPEMTALIHNAFFGFFLVILLSLIGIILHYLFHHRESKSIYLMRRLPNRWELHRRCFSLPCAAIIIAVLTALFLFLLYYGIYLFLTPAGCLPARYL